MSKKILINKLDDTLERLRDAVMTFQVYTVLERQRFETEVKNTNVSFEETYIGTDIFEIAEDIGKVIKKVECFKNYHKR